MESLEAQEKFYSKSHFIILTYLFILEYKEYKFNTLTSGSVGSQDRRQFSDSR